MLIKEVPYTEAPIELLLEADPSRDKINQYLHRSKCVVAIQQETQVGVYVMQRMSPFIYELMSIAVLPEHQKRGIGTALLKHAVAYACSAGAHRLEVGTGTFGYQLAFYQKAGFRVYAVERDFFLHNYDEPIYENGIQLKDMLRLAVDFPDNTDH